MHANHLVYKGFRLSAQVQRVWPEAGAAGLDGVRFTATLSVAPAAGHIEGSDYDVPVFEDGAAVHTPAQAIHLAIEHGRTLVDAWSRSPGARP